MSARRSGSSRSVSPYRFYGLAGVAIGVGLAALGVIAFDLPLYLAWIIGLSVGTFALYGYDKRRAISGSGRVPENVLHGMSLAGGFPGGWAGRFAFRHKTRHTSFLVVLILATVIHGVLIFLWLV